MQLVDSTTDHFDFTPKRRRDKERVIYDMLLLIRKGLAKTRIVYEANLNNRIARSYFGFLISEGYITRNVANKRSSSYTLTDKGAHLLVLLSEIGKELSLLLPQNAHVQSVREENA